MHAPALALFMLGMLGTLAVDAEPSPDPAPPPEPAPTLTLGQPPPAASLPPEPEPELTPDAEPESTSVSDPTEELAAEGTPTAPEAEAEAEDDEDWLSEDEDWLSEDDAEDELFAEDEPTATAESFQLQPPAPREVHPPSVFGRTWASVGITASSSSLGLSLGAVRFVIPHIGLGGDVEDVVVLTAPSFNIFQITPKVVFLMLPYRRFSPLVQAGFGLAVLSRWAFARWVIGTGVALAVGQRLTVRAGVDLEGLLPDRQFGQHFKCPITASPCSLYVSPWIGIGMRF